MFALDLENDLICDRGSGGMIIEIKMGFGFASRANDFGKCVFV